MFKVTKEVKLAGSLRNRPDKIPGRAIQVQSTLPSEECPDGGIHVFIGKRLTPNTMGKRRTFAGTSLGWINEFRDKRMVVTELALHLRTAILLRDALNKVIGEATIDEVSG